MKNRIVMLMALTSVINLVGCSTPLGDPLSSPKLFASDAYCKASGAPLQIPDSITRALEDDADASADVIANALLVKAATQIAHYAEDSAACQAVFADGADRFYASLDFFQEALRAEGGYKASDIEQIAAIQYEITQLWREDQSARQVYITARTDDDRGAAFWAQRLAAAHAQRIDDKSTQYMQALLQKVDWIDQKRYGKSVSAHAWILVQHADDHVALQELALSRMQPFLEQGAIRPSNYAYLWDRVAVNRGRLQRYGTQPTWECTDDKKLILQPMEEPAGVNARRSELGMNSVEDGLESMARGVCL